MTSIFQATTGNWSGRFLNFLTQPGRMSETYLIHLR